MATVDGHNYPATQNLGDPRRSGLAGVGESAGQPSAPILVALIVAAAVHAGLILGVNTPRTALQTVPPTLDIILTQDDRQAIGANAGPSTTPDRKTAKPASLVPRTAASPARKPPQQWLSSADPASTDPAQASGNGPAVPPATPPDARAEAAASMQSPDYPEMARMIASAHNGHTPGQSSGAGQTRSKRLTHASAKSPVEAAYLDMWQKKVERIGRANYPPGRIMGELSVLAVVRYDGTLREVRVLEPSGHSALDEAALRIVRLAAPFSHFPTDLRKNYDQLEIVRQWRFEHTARRGQ